MGCVMQRREYVLSLTINGRSIRRVIIDSHYEVRHKNSITDEIILSLVQEIDGIEQLPEDVDAEGFEYYSKDRLNLNDKIYKLIWLLRKDADYIGIINAFRRD